MKTSSNSVPILPGRLYTRSDVGTGSVYLKTVKGYVMIHSSFPDNIGLVRNDPDSCFKPWHGTVTLED